MPLLEKTIHWCPSVVSLGSERPEETAEIQAIGVHVEDSSAMFILFGAENENERFINLTLYPFNPARPCLPGFPLAPCEGSRCWVCDSVVVIIFFNNHKRVALCSAVPDVLKPAALHHLPEFHQHPVNRGHRVYQVLPEKKLICCINRIQFSVE